MSTAGSELRLLTRRDCHLCDAAAALSALGADFATIDVDAHPDLVQRYGDRVPVLLAGEVEIASAPIDEAALQHLGIGRQTCR